MTDQNHPLAVEPNEANLAEPDDYFDGNEEELSEPDDDLDDEITSPDDEDDADEPDDEDQDDDADESEDDDQTLEFVELERNGKKFKVPAELKDEFLMQGDYTRKTQEVAEQRKAIDAERAQVQQMAQVSQEEVAAMVDLRGIDARLHQYGQVDWQALYEEDFVSATQHRAAYDDLKDKRASALENYQQASEKRTAMSQQATERRLLETAEFAQKKIPGWTQELDAKLTEFAESKGITRETLREAYNPGIYDLLHKAYVGEQFLAQQAAAKPKPRLQGAKKPLSKVVSKGAPAGKKDIGEMSMDEYAAHMNKREKARRANRR